MQDQLKKSYGQYNNLSSLPEKIRNYFYEREIKGLVKKFAKQRTDINVLDIGCGYYARMLQTLSPFIEKGVGVDLEIADSVLLANKKIIPLKKSYMEALQDIHDESFEVILIISVLEHLENPQYCLKEARRILKKGGILLINVPTWHSKTLLEFLAFKLKINEESFYSINDHKMYYDKSDLWKLLIQSGFKPNQIKMRYHKFWLALFSNCRK